jgi:Glucose / Sorbosone dehydrogenase
MMLGHNVWNWQRTIVALAATCGVIGATDGSAYAAYSVTRVANGLNQPTYLTQAPGDNSSLYFVERSDANSQLGRIRKFDLQTQSLSTFLDLTGQITSDGGVLSMAFSPDYQSNGLFYVTSNVNGDNRLDEYKTVSGVPQFQRRLLQYSNLANVFHTINQPFFRPGGNSNELYLTTGDGGTQADQPQFNPALIESSTSVYGKVLKFDLNASFPTPATDATHAGISLVAKGLRNPFRSSFDRGTGNFYIGDVGFNSVEEVDFIPSSQFTTPSATPLDFGWTSREGTVATVGSSAGGPGSPGDINPIFDYAHSSGVVLPHPSAIIGSTVVGGYVYRGPVAELQGRYFFSDFVNGQIYSGVFNPATNPSSYNGTNLTNLVDHTAAFDAAVSGGANIQYVTGFSEDNAGNLYMIKFGNSFFPNLGEGEIFKISAAAAIDAVVNRNTGAITLTNNSGAAVSLSSLTINSASGTIDRTALTSITGHYDFNGDKSVDNNNAWTISSPADSHTLFSETSTGDPGMLAAGQQIVLSPSGGWIRYPTEDISVSLLSTSNTVISASIAYVGNNSIPFARSDLNFDGTLTAADWAIFVAHATQNMSGLSKAQSYALGDLDGDGDNDYSDYRLFKADYIQTNGAAAFAALPQNVPEISTLSLGVLGALLCTLFRTCFAKARAAAPRPIYCRVTQR